VFIEESRDDLIGFFGFRELGIVPKGMRQGFKDDEVGLDARPKECPMKNRRAAEQQVARARNEERRREAFQVGIDG
jgi:hypothetical protein